MKKIICSLIALISLCSCDSDEFTRSEIVSDKYIIQTVNKNGSEIPRLYIKAVNKAGGVDISLPGSDAPMFVENNDLQSTIELYFTLTPEIMSSIKQLNYINFISDNNLVVSYNNADGQEEVFPDMLKEDGSLKKSFKYRKDFDRIYPRVSEKLSRFLKLPFMGELIPPYSFCYKKNNSDFLIYADWRALNSYAPMLQMFITDPATLKMVNDIMEQYNKSGDILEVGLYLKSSE